MKLKQLHRVLALTLTRLALFSGHANPTSESLTQSNPQFPIALVVPVLTGRSNAYSRDHLRRHIKVILRSCWQELSVASLPCRWRVVPLMIQESRQGCHQRKYLTTNYHHPSCKLGLRKLSLHKLNLFCKSNC